MQRCAWPGPVIIRPSACTVCRVVRSDQLRLRRTECPNAGVDTHRLISRGYGETVPIDDNATETGRQNNRRVVFRILQQEIECD